MLYKNKDIILNKAKEFYINNKESIKDYQKQYRKHNPLTEDKKQKIKEYQKQYRKDMTDGQKQKIKEYKKSIMRQKN